VDTLSSYGQLISRMADGSRLADGASTENGAAPNGSASEDKANPAREEALREASLVLLQLVNALKGLQAQGEEEVSPDVVLLLRDPAMDHSPQLALVHSPRHSEQVTKEGIFYL